MTACRKKTAPLKDALTAVVALLFGAAASCFATGVGTNSICPEDYNPTAVNNICQHQETSQALVYDERRDSACVQGFERILGVDACIAASSTVDIVVDTVLVRENKSELCPQGFQKEGGLALCAASDSLVYREGSRLKRRSERQVPLHALSDISIAAAPSYCPPGYLRPPGFSCIEDSIVNATQAENANLGLNLRVHACDDDYFRPLDRNFCVPSEQLPLPSIDEISARVDVAIAPGKGREEGWQKLLLCPNGYLEVWMKKPVFERDRYLKKYRPARICMPKSVDGGGRG